MVARSPGEALLIAQQLKFPVAMKVNSHDITHKTDVGGVLLNLKNAHEVRAAYQDILDTVREKLPDGACGWRFHRTDDSQAQRARIDDRRNQRCRIRAGDHIWSGGTEVEIKSTPAIALPPLNKFSQES